MTKILKSWCFSQKSSIYDENPEFWVFRSKNLHLWRKFWILGVYAKNAPFKTKILNIGCLSQKCPIYDENPEFWVFRPKMLPSFSSSIIIIFIIQSISSYVFNNKHSSLLIILIISYSSGILRRRRRRRRRRRQNQFHKGFFKEALISKIWYAQHSLLTCAMNQVDII